MSRRPAGAVRGCVCACVSAGGSPDGRCGLLRPIRKMISRRVRKFLLPKGTAHIVPYRPALLPRRCIPCVRTPGRGARASAFRARYQMGWADKGAGTCAISGHVGDLGRRGAAAPRRLLLLIRSAYLQPVGSLRRAARRTRRPARTPRGLARRCTAPQIWRRLVGLRGPPYATGATWLRGRSDSGRRAASTARQAPTRPSVSVRICHH